MQPAQREAQRGLKAGDSVGSVLELDFLFVSRMGCVVGGNCVDDAVENAFDHGVAVSGGTQRRIHFGVCRVEAHVFLSEQEMMRSDFAGDAQSAAPRLADGSKRSCR